MLSHILKSLITITLNNNLKFFFLILFLIIKFLALIIFPSFLILIYYIIKGNFIKVKFLHFYIKFLLRLYGTIIQFLLTFQNFIF